MADKNMVMDSADMLVAVHGFTHAEVAAADEGGFVGERQVDNVGLVKYFVTKKGNVEMPKQFGDF